MGRLLCAGVCAAAISAWAGPAGAVALLTITESANEMIQSATITLDGKAPVDITFRGGSTKDFGFAFPKALLPDNTTIYYINGKSATGCDQLKGEGDCLAFRNSTVTGFTFVFSFVSDPFDPPDPANTVTGTIHGADGVSDVLDYKIISPAEVRGIPEPGTWALMIVGLGALGGWTRSRRTPVLAS